MHIAWTGRMGLGLGMVAALCVGGCATPPPAAPTAKAPTEAAVTVPKWEMGVQAWTFRSCTFVETLQKLSDLGIRSVEAYPGQKLEATGTATFGHDMDAGARTLARAALEAAGVKLVAYGVVSGRDEAEWTQIFDFAKAMGIATICTEPAEDQLALVERLANQHGINVALHNHPQPSRYWNPDTVLAACAGRSARFGACADTGHWVRSGLDPVECLRKLQGRIVELHLKDLNVRGPDARDVPWGSGMSDVPAMLTELARQGFGGAIVAEYEHEDATLQAAVGQCAQYLREWRGPARFSRDVAAIWASLPPSSQPAWTDAMLSNLTPPAPPPKPADLGPQDDTSAYRDTTDDLKGSVTASGPGFENEGPGNVFDNTLAKWCINATAVWVQYRYPDNAKQTVTAYALTTANDAPGRDPCDWKLLGSDDGQNWQTVDERKDEKFSARHQKRLFEVKTPGAFNQYRLDIATNRGDVSSQIAELELLLKK